MSGIIDYFGELWGRTNDSVGGDLLQAGKSALSQAADTATEVVRGTPDAFAKVVPREQMKQMAEAAAKSEAFAKTVLYTIAGACILAGSAYMYRGFNQNCSLRGVTKAPVSLIPSDEGMNNEQRSGPLSLFAKVQSATQRIAIPAIAGLSTVLVGALALWNIEALTQIFVGKCDFVLKRT